jgi:c-di-GMP-binding flagellar brake protein YcgR
MTLEMFSYKSKEQRKYFRVRPSDKDPVIIQLAEKTIQVCDISAGGIGSKNHKLKEGQVQAIKINLPDRTTIESSKIKILSVDENNICHAKFIDMESSEQENIHRYTLKRQVEIAKKNKGVKYCNWHTRA